MQSSGAWSHTAVMWWLFDCWVNKDMSWTEEIPPWNRITVLSAQNVSQLILNTHKPVRLVWSEGWGRGQRAIQPSFIASRFMLLAPLRRSHTWKGRRGHLIQPNVPLLTPVRQTRHQGACDSPHLNNAIVPTDTDRQKHTHHYEVDRNKPQSILLFSLSIPFNRHNWPGQICKWIPSRSNSIPTFHQTQWPDLET